MFLAIYWNNHHHLLHAAARVSGGILWANMHLLFWLSLIPFTTAWMGDSRLAPLPTAVYGAVLLMAAFGYWILVNAIVAREGPESRLRAAVGRDVKGNPWIAGAIYVAVALIWICPDPRIERRLDPERT